MLEFDFNRVLQSDGNLKIKTFAKETLSVIKDDSLKYRIMAIKTKENFIPFSNSVTFRKPRGTDLVTASELIPGFCRSKSNVPTPGSLGTIKSPTAGIVPGIKSPPLARTPSPRGFTLIGAYRQGSVTLPYNLRCLSFLCSLKNS